ncbi:MAG: YabP/YqfC family sporulation protein [Clostridiales bacterium]|nr:YabP/YqfC family sporulation protein [Clostridiales bacterium]
MARNTSKKNAKEKNIYSLAERIGNGLELPAEGLPGNAQIELCGNKKAIVSGCRGVLEYDEKNVCVSAGKLSVRFSGANLCISFYRDGEAVICGEIVSVGFSS